MKLGSLGAALLGRNGLVELDPAVSALSMPMAFDSYEEAMAVLGKMRPRFEATLEAQGFVVLGWADAGWERFFSTRPVATPGDLKKLKLLQWQAEPKSAEVWRTAGFSARPGALTDLPAGLKVGLFEACTMTPQVARFGRYFEDAKFMTDLDWALPIGATVVTTAVWNRIPAGLRPALMEAGQEAGARMRGEREASVAAMMKAGLTVVPVDANAKADWLRLALDMYPTIRGTSVPADAFDEAMRLRDEYRARNR
jgi:TRAP-type C4-dicarboxylate transport system substrate-binding protein